MNRQVEQYKNELTSQSKYHLWYGRFDPIKETDGLIFPCSTCGRKPAIVYEPKRNRWEYFCPRCRTKAEGSRKKWQAVLNWNKAPVSDMPFWRDFPLFDLDRFQNPEDAGEYLKKVREVLETRIKNCNQALAAYRKGLRPKPPGKQYQERLKAFLQWCILAQGVCRYWRKNTTKPQGGENVKNMENNAI